MIMQKLLWIAPALLIAGSIIPTKNVSAAQPAPMYQEAVMPSGTPITVRIDQTLDTRYNNPGDRFTATLMQPLVAGGMMIPVGTPFTGRVTAADDSGTFKGRAILALTLDSFRYRGMQYLITTDQVSQVSGKQSKRSKYLIGGGAGVGGAIGAITGGLGGAALGALAGGAAGAAGTAIAGKRQAGIAAETPLTFRLTTPLRM